MQKTTNKKTMDEERKGFFTKDQEKKIDKAIKFKNPILEAVDGPIISSVDNILLQKIVVKLGPELKAVLYEIIDEVVEALPAEG